MSILIKGMGMPENCEDCSAQIIDPTGGASGCAVNHSIILRKRGERRPAECPLVEIPPHGRLVDGDFLTEQLIARMNDDRMFDEHDAADEIEAVIEFVEQMPTVIEAEGRE